MTNSHSKNNLTLKIPLRAGGFTLIELMITVVVAAVLSSLAVASYSQYIERARRVEVQSRLFEVAMQLERVFTVSGSYPATLPATIDATVPTGSSGANIRYQIAYAVASNGFTLSGTPQNSQAADACGVFSLTDANVKSNSGPHSFQQCWQQ
jgi:type IV pilus assembly protein PilE